MNNNNSNSNSNSNNYIFIILFVIFTIALISAWYFIANDRSQDKNKTEQTNDKVNHEIDQLHEELIEAEKLGEKEKVKKLEKEIETRLPDNLKRVLSHIKESTFDLNFYGKVVDQYGEPVANAKIEYGMLTMYFLDKTASGIVETDRNGMFNIKASGYTLSLTMPVHPKLSDKYIPGAAKSPFTSGSSILLESKSQGRGTQSWKGYSKNNPYVIRAWRIESFEELFKRQKNLFLTPDGTAHTFMKKDKYGNMSLKKGQDSKGYLLFTCVRDENGTAGKNGAWQATIVPIDGGILETNDNVLNEAPLDGYQNSILVSMDGGGEYGSSMIRDKKYYFTANNNRTYGSLVVFYEPYGKKKDCIFDINYKINPNGSRNLAVKSEPDY